MVAHKLKTISLVLSICIIAYSIKNKIKITASTPIHFVVAHHSVLSPLSLTTRSHLHAFFDQHYSQFFHSKNCIADILKQFPVLKKVTLEYKQGSFIAHLDAARPVALFNNQTVLTDHDQLTDCSLWNPETLLTIPHIKVTDTTEITLTQKHFLKKLAYEVKDLYHIEWVHDSLIKFHDSRYPRITILGSTNTDSKVVLQQACLDLKEKISKEKTGRKGQNDWCIDVRFKNQMIVFPGGRT